MSSTSGNHFFRYLNLKFLSHTDEIFSEMAFREQKILIDAFGIKKDSLSLVVEGQEKLY